MPETKRFPTRAALACLLALCLAPAVAAGRQQQATPTPSPRPEQPEDGATETKSFARLEGRSLGPAHMGGRAAGNDGVAGRPVAGYGSAPSGGPSKTPPRG